MNPWNKEYKLYIRALMRYKNINEYISWGSDWFMLKTRKLVNFTWKYRHGKINSNED